MSTVEYKRNPVQDRHIEFLLEDFIASFSEISPLFRKRVHSCIEIYFEMFCAHHFPVEFGVLHLIPAKIVELRGSGGTREDEEKTVSQNGFQRRGFILVSLESVWNSETFNSVYPHHFLGDGGNEFLGHFGQFIFELFDGLDRSWILVVEDC